MIWFTSDHHFGHEKIIKYTKRPFSSVEVMDAELIKRWNWVVSPEDTVYHLGDFTLGNHTLSYHILRQLNAKTIYFIPGGHDKRWLKRNLDVAPSEIYAKVEKVQPIHQIKAEGQLIILCHYPLRSWEQSHYGSIHLHGHTHGTIGVMELSSDTKMPPDQKRGKRIDVSVDCWDYSPISLDDVIKISRDGKLKSRGSEI